MLCCARVQQADTVHLNTANPTKPMHAVYGYEVSKVAVYQGRFIVGRTHATLLLVRVW